MTTRGGSQDRKRVAGGKEHEVRYEAKKSGRPKRPLAGRLATAEEGSSTVSAAIKRKPRIAVDGCAALAAVPRA